MKLNYKIDGQGAPLVLLHGLFGSLDNLGQISRVLQNQYQIHRLDLRNHGESGHADTMTYEQMAEDLVQYLSDRGISSCWLLGHSMGGKVAMQAALNWPELFAGLVVADIAPVAYGAHHEAVLNALKALDCENLTSRKQVDEKLQEFIQESQVRQFLLKNLIRIDDRFKWRINVSAIVEQYPVISSAITSSNAFEKPTLFIKGSASAYIKESHKGIIKNYFPQAEHKVLQGASHWLHAEQPKAFSELVNNFILNHSD